MQIEIRGVVMKCACVCVCVIKLFCQNDEARMIHYYQDSFRLLKIKAHSINRINCPFENFNKLYVLRNGVPLQP